MQFTRRLFAVLLLGGLYLLTTVQYLSKYHQCSNYTKELLRTEVLEKELRHCYDIAAGANRFEVDVMRMHNNLAPVEMLGPVSTNGAPVKSPRKGLISLPGAKSNVLLGKGHASQKVAYSVDKLPAQDLLHPHMIPSTVFYVWCGPRWFEFHHYLSLLSVIKELNPDNIIFYYDTYPIVDPFLYSTWFDEIKTAHPFVRTEKLQPADYGCAAFAQANVSFIEYTVNTRGGMYFHEATMLDHFPLKHRNLTLVNALDPTSGQGFLMSRPLCYQPSKLHFQCASISTYNQVKEKPICLNFKEVFYPKDIWEADTPFGRLARGLFYGSPIILQPLQSYDNLVPNIAHMAWIGGGEMDYLFYLCVLSLIHVVEVDMVYIHGDAPPTGPYWERVKHHDRLRIIHREIPREVYGTKVEIISHVTDIWRCDWMIKYGGIYVDTEAIFVRPLDREIRSYDAVGSYDWIDWNPPFPDIMNLGVLIGKRNAPFFHKFQESMKWWIHSEWSWNGLRQPYKIKERHPELILINPHLQVICFEYLCHPTWQPGYHNESRHHLSTNRITDWRKQAYAYHFTEPTPPELLNESNLLASNSMIAEMGKLILEKAGLLPKHSYSNTSSTLPP